MRRGRTFSRWLAALAGIWLGISPALAACPIELAVYSDAGGAASLDFFPTGTNAVVTNSFRMVSGKTVLDGMVMWSDDEPRPIGMLGHNCPKGDATGEALAACTVWQGVVYTADDTGDVGLLPAEGTPAPRRLILADLGRSLRYSPAYDAHAFDKLPADVFILSGCQE
jgi:hypothetical protein